MTTLLIAVASFFAFIVAYNTYGKWLGGKIFELDPDALVPSKELEDGVDYCPSKKSLVFGHHFTSIAGTGPIVGPAIAVFWGWLPALIWVVFGSIFIGAVHDFGALVVSMRNRGQTIGEVAGRMISSRTKILFLLVLFFALTVVLAIFGLVIAAIFAKYPESVLGVWVSLPIAIWMGLRIRKGATNLLPMSMLALVLIYVSIYVGTYHWQIELDVANPTIVWTIILLGYCAVASVLPVWLLLQPRDYINSHQLFLALGLLVVGLLVACVTGKADLIQSTPAVTSDLPVGAPPIWPFLFITIACGAISGFHCLVSSGTSSKQLENETDAQAIGYGSMLLEGALAVVVILACCAGVGMGKTIPVMAGVDKTDAVAKTDAVVASAVPAATTLVGRDAWRETYKLAAKADGTQRKWKDFGLGNKIGAFVDGGANFLTAIGIPFKLGVGIIAVLVACFAATTLDSATRLQRYVIQELAGTMKIKPLTNMYAATALAVVLGAAIATVPGKPGGGAGTGGLLLWPLFGATNQLLAGLALMVTTFYLWRRQKPVWFIAIPMVIMVVMPMWALIWQLFNAETGWVARPGAAGWEVTLGQHKLLGTVGLITFALQIWMIAEAFLAWPRAKGVLEETLPPLAGSSGKLEASGGRSC